MRTGSIVLTSALALGGLLPSAASAALPAAKPPGKAASDVVRWWPVKSSEPLRILHGRDVSVSINSPKRDVKLALIQVSKNGKSLKAVKRATVRKGKVTFALPTPGATYQLRADIGNKRYWSYIQVEHCGVVDGDKAELRLGATSVRAGAALPYELVNTSTTGCITVGEGYSFEHSQPDGTWAPVGGSGPTILIGYGLIPGQAHAKSATVPAAFTPGRYRILDSAAGAVVDGGRNIIRLSAEFDVVP